MEKAIKKLNEHVNVSENKLTGLIKITTIFQDPVIAANVANFIIGREVEAYIQKKTLLKPLKKNFLSMKDSSL